MNRLTRLLFLSAWLWLPLLNLAPAAFAASSSTPVSYLITYNDNAPGPGSGPDTVTFYTIGANGQLSNPTVINLAGQGSGGGYFAASRIVVQNSATSPCLYISEGSSNTIAGIVALTQTVAGNFSASSTDNGVDNGIGLAINSNYLYASFSSSGTIATFALQPGCQLQFLGDIAPAGLNGGTTKAMAVFGNSLVVAYGDGSIESFNVSSGLPVSNGDAQNAAGFAIDEFPSGVVITPDGQWAIFGDDASSAAVEVSDISSGQLTPTVLYSFPSGLNSNNVLLSPDGTLLYVGSNTSGQVSLAFFDTATGVVSYGCTSALLNGFDSTFAFLATPVLQLQPSAGPVLYVAEFGHPSAVGIINVTASGGTCTLQEASGSPVFVASNSLLSIAVVSQPGTAVASSLNPSAYGQSVRFTATVTGNSPTGTVQFNIDGSAFGSPVTLAFGSASSASIATLAVGTHTVTAVYSGDTNNPGSTGTLSGGQVVTQASQTITVTTPAPSTAIDKSSFTVVASATSGLPISFTHSGACTNSNATYTINALAKPGATCTVTMNQAGNSDYTAAPTVNETTTVVTPTAPTVSFTGAPASATYSSIFTVTASSTNDPSVPSITSSGSCALSNTVVNGTTVSDSVTITNGTGTCTLTAQWAASGGYAAAKATQKTAAAKATPVVSFTGAPADADQGANFTVTATSNESGSGAAVPKITATGSCTVGAATNSGPGSYQATVTMTKATGTCTTKAAWVATTDYASASATQTTTAQP